MHVQQVYVPFGGPARQLAPPAYHATQAATDVQAAAAAQPPAYSARPQGE